MPATPTAKVLCGAYSAAELPGIRMYSYDRNSGGLSLMSSFTGILNPSFILPHPNGKWLYSVSETGDRSEGTAGSVFALSLEYDPVQFEILNHQSTLGQAPCHLQFDMTKRWLFSTNYSSGDAGVWPIKSDGSLGEISDWVSHQKFNTGPNRERQEGPHAHSLILSPDNRFAIVADLGCDLLVIYRFDPMNGKLIFHQAAHARPGAGPRHMTFHPSGRLLYVANELNSTVTVYEYDPVAGNLNELQILGTLPSNAPENIIADIHLSEDAKRLYVSNRGHNSLAVFAAGEAGLLTLVGIFDCGGNWPRNFALAPDGRFILVANQYSNELCSLPIQGGTGEIGLPVGRIASPQVTCIQFIGTHD